MIIQNIGIIQSLVIFHPLFDILLKRVPDQLDTLNIHTYTIIELEVIAQSGHDIAAHVRDIRIGNR